MGMAYKRKKLSNTEEDFMENMGMGIQKMCKDMVNTKFPSIN